MEKHENFVQVDINTPTLNERILSSGLKKSWIATQVGISKSHFTMMLNGNATMSKDVKDKIEELLK